MSNFMDFSALSPSGLSEWYGVYASPAIRKRFDRAILQTRLLCAFCLGGFYFPGMVMLMVVLQATGKTPGQNQMGQFILGALMWMAVFGAFRVRLNERLRRLYLEALSAMKQEVVAGSKDLPVAVLAWEGPASDTDASHGDENLNGAWQNDFGQEIH